MDPEYNIILINPAVPVYSVAKDNCTYTHTHTVIYENALNKITYWNFEVHALVSVLSF